MRFILFSECKKRGTLCHINLFDFLLWELSSGCTLHVWLGGLKKDQVQQAGPSCPHWRALYSPLNLRTPDITTCSWGSGVWPWEGGLDGSFGVSEKSTRWSSCLRDKALRQAAKVGHGPRFIGFFTQRAYAEQTWLSKHLLLMRNAQHERGGEKGNVFLQIKVFEAFRDDFIFLLLTCFAELFLHSLPPIFLSLSVILVYNYNTYTP